MASITRAARSEVARTVALALYYLGVLAALVLMYGRGDFTTPPFIYQAF